MNRALPSCCVQRDEFVVISLLLILADTVSLGGSTADVGVIVGSEFT